MPYEPYSCRIKLLMTTLAVLVQARRVIMFLLLLLLLLVYFYDGVLDDPKVSLSHIPHLCSSLISTIPAYHRRDPCLAVYCRFMSAFLMESLSAVSSCRPVMRDTTLSTR